MNKIFHKIPAGWYLFALGLGCIAIGICRDEVAAVYMKAIRICMECIGIG